MRTSPSRRAVLAAVAAASTAAAVAFSAAAGAAAPASARGPRWAAPDRATVHPGVTVTMAQVRCRVGFVLTNGRDAYLAVPASCSGVSGGQPTDGCTEAQVPVGVPATIQGARYEGRLVYSSFTQMAAHGVTDPDACAMNGLSLIRLDRRDIRRTSPSVPVLGGPTGLDTGQPATGDALPLYVTARGQALEMQNGNRGWSNTVVPSTAVSAVDVGAPVLDPSGRALGMLAQTPRTEGGPAVAGDLAKELAYLHHIRGFRHVRLAVGSAFSG